jgi:hypothetical protein
MKANLQFPKSVTVKMMKEAKKGQSLVFQGHRPSANAPLFRAGFKFSTNQAWIILMGKESPVPVTILTITGLPNEAKHG